MQIVRRNRKFTPEMKKLVGEDYNAGIKVKDIADKYKITLMQVYRIIKQLEENYDEKS